MRAPANSTATEMDAAIVLTTPSTSALCPATRVLHNVISLRRRQFHYVGESLCSRLPAVYPHLSKCSANVNSEAASHSRNAAGGVSLRISLVPMNSTATSSSCPITGMNEGMSWIGLNTYPMEQLAITLAGHGTFGDRSKSVSKCTCFVTAMICSHHLPLSNLSVKLVTAAGSVMNLRRWMCGQTRDLRNHIMLTIWSALVLWCEHRIRFVPRQRRRSGRGIQL